MACALGRAEHAQSRAMGLCNHQNNLKFHHNTFKSTFQSLPDVQIQFRDKFSLSTFQGEFKFYSFKAMQGYWFVDFYDFHYYLQTLHTSQGDFRLMSFTAGRCSTPLIPNDQLRRNGVRSSDLIVSVSPSRPSGSKADRDEPRSVDERSESAGVGPKAPSGRAKRGRWRRTERTLRTEPHWSFGTALIPNDQIRSNGVRFRN